MVSNSAKLDRRTKQHTQFGVSASNGSRGMGPTKIGAEKRKRKKKKKKEKKNERPQSHKASPTGIANNVADISEWGSKEARKEEKGRRGCKMLFSVKLVVN